MAELTVDRVYGNALFEVAEERKCVEIIKSELNDIQSIFIEHPTLFQLVTTPRLSKEEKKQMITELFSERVSQEIINFLYVLIDKGRMLRFSNIVHQYNKVSDMRQNVSKGILLSPFPLSEGDIFQFERKVSLSLGKEIYLENQLDPTILGGVKLFIQDQLIDATVNKSLQGILDAFGSWHINQE